jgi:hypothetical protein
MSLSIANALVRSSVSAASHNGLLRRTYATERPPLSQGGNNRPMFVICPQLSVAPTSLNI